MQLHALTKHTKWRHQVEAFYKESYLYLTVTGSHAGQVNRHSPTDEWGTCYDSTLTVSSAIRGWKSNCVPVQNICKAVRLGVSTLNACLMTRRAEQRAASQLQFAVHTHSRDLARRGSGSGLRPFTYHPSTAPPSSSESCESKIKPDLPLPPSPSSSASHTPGGHYQQRFVVKAQFRQQTEETKISGRHNMQSGSCKPT